MTHADLAAPLRLARASAAPTSRACVARGPAAQSPIARLAHAIAARSPVARIATRSSRACVAAPRVVALVVAALSLAPGVAAAAPRPARVVIEVCSTPPFDVQASLRILSIELAASGLALVETSTLAATFVTISVPECDASASRVELAVVDGTAGATRTLRIEPRAPSTPRVVALAAAELVRSLASRREPARASSREPAPPASSTSRRADDARVVVRPTIIVERAPPPRVDPRAALALSLGVDAFPSVAGGLPALAIDGPIVTSSTGASTAIRVDAGLQARGGTKRHPNGNVDVFTLTAGLAVRSVHALAGAELALGPRIAAGWVTANGRSTTPGIQGARIHGSLVEAWLELLVRVPLTPSWSVGGRAGAGYVLSGLAAQADGYDVTGVDGPAIGLGLSTWLAL